MGFFDKEYKDEYGFITRLKDILKDDQYKGKNTSEKIELLLEIINQNNQLLTEIRETEPVEEPEIIENNHSKEETASHHHEPKNISSNYKLIESAPTIEDMHKYLPRKEDKLAKDKLAKIKCYLISVIDAYDNLLLTTSEEDVVNYLIENKENLEEKLAFLNKYEKEEEKLDEELVSSEENIEIYYFHQDGTNLVLEDLLKEDIDKYTSYLALIESMKGQLFKGFKRLNEIYGGLYQVRNSDQRIIFDYLSKNSIIIVYAFTKKVKSDKKYYQSLNRRAEKYKQAKEEILNRLKKDPEGFKEEQQESAAQILSLLETKNKAKIKRK